MKYTVHLVVLDYFRNIVGSSNVKKNSRSCSRTIQSWFDTTLNEKP